MNGNNNELDVLQESAKNEISNAQNEQDLNNLKANYLGKKSRLSEIMSTMRELSIEKKKELGQKANEFRTKIEEFVENKRQELLQKVIDAKLKNDAIDVTMPAKKFKTGKLNPLTQTIRELEDVCTGMGFMVEEGPEVEEDLYNFELLNLPKGHPAREMQDSFYIDENTLLRTHTSPVQARTLLKSKGQPIKIICPGKVYRRDNDDATHSHQFMQCEGLVVGENVTMADLKGTLVKICSHVFGSDLRVRFRPSFFPFTEPSVEVDVECFKCKGVGCNLCKGSGWIELLGGGMVHPNVLKMCGYDSEKYQGFAFGIGIERLTMMKYGIDDVRNFYIDDERFLNQF
ncbi:MAG: phenylalanine--tRNA ligase subunit alpha [Bacilli bacterium]|nr:phenylalanine--tRNA ligase subunit alpha [Bacilli bacterium]